jgi:hypothetical protein
LGFINRGSVVRLTVLVVVATLALTWQQLSSQPRTSSQPDTSSQAADVPAVRAVVPGPTPAPAVTPLSAPARQETATKKPAHHKAGRAKRHHVQHRRAKSRHARARHRTRHSRGKSVKSRSHGGRDIGWPQCPRNVGFRGRYGLGQPMPDPGVRFVIVGLTNGRAFTPNPCLARHVRWVRTHHVHASAYAFAAYPSRADVRRHRTQGPYDGRRFVGALMNAGYAGARYNVRTMQRHGFVTPHVWLDVEPSSSRPWSGRRDWNGAVVKGWVRAYRDAGYTVGIYSTTLLWRGIVGRLRLGLPEWRTSGPVSSGAALRKCHDESIQGGRAVIAQWWTARRDFDRICSGPPRTETMARYFHKW